MAQSNKRRVASAAPASSGRDHIGLWLVLGICMLPIAFAIMMMVTYPQ